MGTMTRDEAVSRVKQGLGFISGRTTAIQNALIDVQDRLEQEAERPWFLLTEVTSSSTVSGEERVPFPTGWLGSWEEDALYYHDPDAETGTSKWTPLLKGELDTLRLKYPTAGVPKAYAVDSKYYRILPEPDAVYALKQIFYKADDVLSTNINNKWLTHASDLLIGMAGLELTGPSGSHEEIREYFRKLETNGRARILQRNIEFANTNREWLIGGED